MTKNAVQGKESKGKIFDTSLSLTKKASGKTGT